MRPELYQQETAVIATIQGRVLDEVRGSLQEGQHLSRLEENGVLHALQILIENAIGKAKQLLKAAGEPVPISAYDSFAVLANRTSKVQNHLESWNAVIGIRNRIVHDYMNIDMRKIYDSVRDGRYRFVVEFLLDESL